jgi:NitT/TauT family transport system substrate-binding protein
MLAPLDRRRFLLGALGMAGAVALGACGGDDDDDDDAATATTSGDEAEAPSGDLTVVRLGLLPITDVAPMFLASDRGTFAEHGLDVEPTFAAGGAAILPSVESGEFDVGYSNIVSLLLLQSRGGAYKLLAGGGLTATGDTPDYSQLLVLNDSPFETMADLSGRRVAINTLRNALEIVVRESVDQAGGDHESIQFVEIPFPDMAAALEAGEVDAIQHNEPFQTILQETGTVRTLGQPFVDAAAGEVLAFYFVKADAAESDLAVGFRDAMAEANAYAADHEDEVRGIIPEYTQIEPDVAEAVILPPWVEDSLKESSLQVYAELMTTYGLVEEMPDYEALLP